MTNRKSLLILPLLVLLGSWQCKTTPTLTAHATAQTPITPPSWSVGNWYVDGQNVEGTSSDQNSCTSLATACITYNQVAVHNWGTYSPILTNALTNINVVSNLAPTDPIIYLPPGSGGHLQFLGMPSTKVASGTIINGAAIVAKNRTSPANGQLLEATFSGAAVGNVAVGDLVNNTTHSSYAWVWASVSGNEFAISQPIAPMVPSVPNITVTEVDTWAQTDTATTFTLPQMTVASISGTPSTFISHVDVQEIASPVVTVSLFSDIAFVESRITGPLNISGPRQNGGGATITFRNCDIVGGEGAQFGEWNVTIDAGQVRTHTLNLGNESRLDYDAIFGGSSGPTYGSNTILNTAYIDTTAGGLLLFGAIQVASGGVAASPQVWGPGTIEVASGSMVFPYAGAVAAFPIQGGAQGFVTIGGGVNTAYAIDMSVNPAVIRGPRNLTATLLDTAVSGGGFQNTANTQEQAVSASFGAVMRSGSL
jgi:hypothetical protein